MKRSMKMKQEEEVAKTKAVSWDLIEEVAEVEKEEEEVQAKEEQEEEEPAKEEEDEEEEEAEEEEAEEERQLRAQQKQALAAEKQARQHELQQEYQRQVQRRLQIVEKRRLEVEAEAQRAAEEEAEAEARRQRQSVLIQQQQAAQQAHMQWQMAQAMQSQDVDDAKRREDEALETLSADEAQFVLDYEILSHGTELEAASQQAGQACQAMVPAAPSAKLRLHHSLAQQEQSPIPGHADTESGRDAASGLVSWAVPEAKIGGGEDQAFGASFVHSARPRSQPRSRHPQ